MLSVSDILSIAALVTALLVLVPYLYNRFYKPDLWLYFPFKVLPKNGGQVQFAIHSKNKQRVMVESVWVRFCYGSEIQEIRSAGLPPLFSGQRIPPSSMVAPPPSLIGGPMVISRENPGLGAFTFEIVRGSAKEFVAEIAILSRIYQGDLPPLVDIYPTQLTERIFTQTIQIRED